jgi:hypothetical protein
LQRQGAQQLGAVCGHAILPDGAFELTPRSMLGTSQLRIAAEASWHQHNAEEIDLAYDNANRPWELYVLVFM